MEQKRKSAYSTITLGLILCAAMAAQAHEPVKKGKHPPWTGTNFSLGIVENTGNTQQTDVNLGTNVQYEKNRWKNVFNVQAQVTINQKVTNKEQINANEQVNYDFSKESKSFLYGAGVFSYNRFGPYEYQSTAGPGYGYKLLTRQSFKWSVQAGPALRYDRTGTEKQGQRHIISQFGMNVGWDLAKNIRVSEIFRYDFGRPYDYLNAVTSLNTRLVGHWSLLLSYMVEYYSKTPRGSEYTKKLDTTTTLALAYNL